ncbi:hypothetical protein Pelo_18258 [Pelomyxa schiedti]|nr:hypothetical protein Pelo_18258 [Pelomyxa schiedti]
MLLYGLSKGFHKSKISMTEWAEAPEVDKLSPLVDVTTLGIDVAKAFLGAYKATVAHYFQKWTSCIRSKERLEEVCA